MNWNVKDIEVFEAEKAYVDTAVIPVVPVDFGEDIRVSAAQSEFINLLTLHLERQFKGRMMMIPSFTYRMSSSMDSEVSELSQWAEELTGSGVKHVFFLTSDSGWKKVEDKLGEGLIWVPSIPLENLDEQYKHSIMEDQVKQLLNVIVQKWQKNS
ncbi:YpiF family protein [Rossellomorea vietnamensis]|uniref:YpiF family protein n=1 Tax=Rossellomorea vietnamensis TaxID=218284 RepID=UPI003D296AEA